MVDNLPDVRQSVLVMSLFNTRVRNQKLLSALGLTVGCDHTFAQFREAICQI